MIIVFLNHLVEVHDAHEIMYGLLLFIMLIWINTQNPRVKDNACLFHGEPFQAWIYFDHCKPRIAVAILYL